MNTQQLHNSRLHKMNIREREDYISHELRISLTGILGASYVFDKIEMTREQKECLEMINISAKRLLLLADSLN